MGLSGSGKSTLIRHVNRLIEPTVGEVVVGGNDVAKMTARELREFRRSHAAMVFQKFALLPHRTVFGNVVYGLEVSGQTPARQQDAARYWIDRVGLSGFEDRYPNQLSGGMQQRVGLARALANDTEILLMDEAFSALDPLIRTDMQAVLLDLQNEVRKTVVFITHDLDEALRLGDRIAILRDGEVIQQGTGQEIVLAPADAYITNFVKDVNRGRVIQAATIMEPLKRRARPEGPAIDAGAPLEDAARMMTDDGSAVAHVVNEKGKPTGVLTLPNVIGAMVTPATHDETAQGREAAE
jgi:glycine betaine/proline transport system ATP-binding protein